MIDKDELLAILTSVFICLSLIGFMVFMSDQGEDTVGALNGLSVAMGSYAGNIQTSFEECVAQNKMQSVILKDIYSNTEDSLSVLSTPEAPASNDKCELYEFLVMTNTMTSRNPTP